MEAEEDAERLLRRTEKRAFAAFKISFYEKLLLVSWHAQCAPKLLVKSILLHLAIELEFHH
jgi:hypothetical protein